MGQRLRFSQSIRRKPRESETKCRPKGPQKNRKECHLPMERKKESQHTHLNRKKVAGKGERGGFRGQKTSSWNLTSKRNGRNLKSGCVVYR